MDCGSLLSVLGEPKPAKLPYPTPVPSAPGRPPHPSDFTNVSRIRPQRSSFQHMDPPLGLSWGYLELSFGQEATKWSKHGTKRPQETLLERSWSTLVASWGNLGAILEPSCGHLGAISEPHWSLLESYWGHTKTSVSPRRDVQKCPKIAILGSDLGLFEPSDGSKMAPRWL